MDFRVGNLFFTSKFDSGNLARVERVIRDEDAEPTNNGFYPGQELRPDYECNVWTKPDCGGTEFENGNRSWFYFGVKGWSPNRLIKINIMNMNRQGKLYSQGHSPIVRTLPGKPKWERIRDKPTYETVDGNFILTFFYRFPDIRGGTTYFSFCYPWSYTECQTMLAELDKKYDHCKNLTSRSPRGKIYYHREVLCHTLDKRNIDLITISSCHNITDELEPRFDPKLFPERSMSRCKKFADKRVYFLSSRVHPGETPASFVFNGFLEFILREDDERAKQLRKQFVFKLIPMLNPDGVARGHYRTDQRGVNLNRMYLDPSFELHPSIYASKSVVVYHHVENRVRLVGDQRTFKVNFPYNPESVVKATPCPSLHSLVAEEPLLPERAEVSNQTLNIVYDDDGGETPSTLTNRDSSIFTHRMDSQRDLKAQWGGRQGAHREAPVAENNWAGQPLDGESSGRGGGGGAAAAAAPVRVERLNLADLDGTDTSLSDNNLPAEEPPFDPVHTSSNCSSVLSYIDRTQNVESHRVDSELRLRLSELRMSEDFKCNYMSTSQAEDTEEADANTDHLGNEGSEDESDTQPIPDTNINAPHLSDPRLREIPPSESGIAFYVDLHGHASKRGCFIYGNYFENEDTQVENMLYPRLITINSPHFDFTACNFSERNMYTKDRRDGMSKEGSGRVAIHKAIGIITSYTLECNYNTGRMVNPVPPAFGDDGRASPPPLCGFPPKYTPAHFEEVGRALAVAALDLHNTNPWSRITLSELTSIHGVREAVRRYLRNLRGGPRIPRNPSMRSLNKLNGAAAANGRPARGGASGDSSGSLQQQQRGGGGALRPGGVGGAPSRASVSDSATSASGPPRPAFSRYAQQTYLRKELAPVREATRTNMVSSQTRRRTFPMSNSNQKASSAPPSAASTSTSTVTTTTSAVTAGGRGESSSETLPRQFSADTSLRIMEEDKVQQLKHCNLVHISKKAGPPSRIPLPTGRSNLHLPSPTAAELSSPQSRFFSRGNLRTQKGAASSTSSMQQRKASEETSGGLSDNLSVVSAPAVAAAAAASISASISASHCIEPSGVPPPLPPALNAPDLPGPEPPNEPSRRKKKFTYTKRRSFTQSPKNSSSKTPMRPQMSGDNEGEKKYRRRRRRVNRKAPTPPLSDEDLGQADFAVHGNSMDKKANKLTPRIVTLSMTRHHCAPPFPLTYTTATPLQLYDKALGTRGHGAPAPPPLPRQ